MRPHWQLIIGVTFALGCDRESPPNPATGVAIDSLLGAWSADGENFAWVVEADSILFEADMLRHPYRVTGDTLIIERGDPGGPQKTRIVRITRDSLYIQDAQYGSSEVLIRLR